MTENIPPQSEDLGNQPYEDPSANETQQDPGFSESSQDPNYNYNYQESTEGYPPPLNESYDYSNAWDQAYYDNNAYNPNITRWVVTIYPYEAQNENELSFVENVVIGVVEERDDGWIYGDLQGALGLFPANYVQPMESTDQQAATEGAPQKAEDEETIRKRREKREKMKEQYAQTKQKVVEETKVREQLENEIKELTEKKQKLRKALREQKAKTSDKQTLLYDILKFAFELEIQSDLATDSSLQMHTSHEALTQFVNEIPKEAKNSSALNPFVQKFTPKAKDLLKQMETYVNVLEDNGKTAKDLIKDLDAVVKVLQTNV